MINLIYMFFGFMLGIIITLFIAWVDTQMLDDCGNLHSPSKFTMFLMATSWELLFFCCGSLVTYLFKGVLW